jgi:hypothetical protein
MVVSTRFLHVPEARARFGDRVDRLGSFLGRVDPLADEVAAALEGTPGGWHLFEEAAKHGVERVPGAPASFRALFDQAEHVPMWVDWDTVDRGGEVLLRAGPLGGLVLALKSLVLGYTSPAGNKPLVLSGRLEEQSSRRILETARFVHATLTPRAMHPRGEGWQITLKVRLIHAHVRRMIGKSGRWEGDAWGAPINQHDQAATLLLFSTILLEGLRQLGMRIPPAEAEAYVQLWRWSGWVMGVDPELLPATEAEGVRLREVITATMGEPDDDSRRLARALLESPLRRAGTQKEQANARRAVRVNGAMCRYLLGSDIADQLAIPRTPWRHMLPFVKRLVSSVELVRARVPFGDAHAVRAGTRYWDRIVALGLAGGAADFALPERLARAA